MMSNHTPEDKDQFHNTSDDEQPDDDFEAMLQNALGTTSGDPDFGLEAPSVTGPLDEADDVLDLPVPDGHKSGFVAVVGKPNVGKSTLINAIVGEKIAIVSPKPQTTRLRQLGIYTTDVAQVVFVDTPGIHNPRNNLGHFMVDVATRALRDADVILFLTDISSPLNEQDRNVAKLINEVVEPESNTKVVRILNKIDLHSSPEALQDDVDEHLALTPYTEWTTCIATDQAGIPDIIDTLLELLPQGPRYYPPDQVSDMRLRDMAAEIVREAVLMATQQEVPHSVATIVEEFKERPNGMTYIACDIYVERESQKSIIIGKGGQMVKKISIRARQGIEETLQRRVYLELRVKVMKNWRRSEQMLQRLGYRIGQY